MKARDFKTVVAMRRHLREENEKFPIDGGFVDVPKERWPGRLVPCGLVGVKRSREFLVQVYEERDGMIRLTVNRTWVNAAGDYAEEISWEELQAVKRGCGFGNRDAVEVFPPDEQVVNRANMRHLWVYPAEQRLPFVWRTSAGSGEETGAASEEIMGIGHS